MNSSMLWRKRNLSFQWLSLISQTKAGLVRCGVKMDPVCIFRLESRVKQSRITRVFRIGDISCSKYIAGLAGLWTVLWNVTRIYFCYHVYEPAVLVSTKDSKSSLVWTSPWKQFLEIPGRKLRLKSLFCSFFLLSVFFTSFLKPQIENLFRPWFYGWLHAKLLLSGKQMFSFLLGMKSQISVCKQSFSFPQRFVFPPWSIITSQKAISKKSSANSKKTSTST